MTHRGRIFTGLVSAAVGAAAVAAAPRATACDDHDAASARVELGRRLFFDPAIGREGRVSCAACHDPEHGFSDARPRSQDETRELPRHSQPLVDLAGDGFHWDGEFVTVRDVIDARILPGAIPARAEAARALGRLRALKSADATPDVAAVGALVARLDGGGSYGDGVMAGELSPGDIVELVEPEKDEDGKTVPAQTFQVRKFRLAPSAGDVSARLVQGGRYDKGFAAAFGDAAVTPQRVGDALEAYLGSLKSSTNAADRFLGGDTAALSASASRGLDLFRGKANCSQCHSMDGGRAAFTDGKFHNTGVETAVVAQRRTAGQLSLDVTGPDAGRLAASFAAADRGAFKTPSLRDVAKRAPYFHDASKATLTDVVAYYDQGGTPNAHLDPKIKPLSLSEGERADLVAFLESLTGDVRPGLAAPHALRSSKLTVRVENLDGTPVAHRTVVVRPFGDRLAGTTEAPAPIPAQTDADGTIVLDMPATTHVVVEPSGLAPSAALPDWTPAATFVVAPNDKVVLRVRFADGVAERPAEFFAYAGGVMNPGAPAKFAKVRDLDATESLYAAAPPERLSGQRVCSLSPQNTKGVRGGDFLLDLSLGATNVVDLRTPPASSDEAVRAALAKDVAAIRAFIPPSAKRK